MFEVRVLGMVASVDLVDGTVGVVDEVEVRGDSRSVHLLWRRTLWAGIDDEWIIKVALSSSDQPSVNRENCIIPVLLSTPFLSTGPIEHLNAWNRHLNPYSVTGNLPPDSFEA